MHIKSTHGALLSFGKVSSRKTRTFSALPHLSLLLALWKMTLNDLTSSAPARTTTKSTWEPRKKNGKKKEPMRNRKTKSQDKRSSFGVLQKKLRNICWKSWFTTHVYMCTCCVWGWGWVFEAHGQLTFHPRMHTHKPDKDRHIQTDIFTLKHSNVNCTVEFICINNTYKNPK